MKPTLFTAARRGPYFKSGCRLCGHPMSSHHSEYRDYCDDCPETLNESYHEYAHQEGK